MSGIKHRPKMTAGDACFSGGAKREPLCTFICGLLTIPHPCNLPRSEHGKRGVEHKFQSESVAPAQPVPPNFAEETAGGKCAHCDQLIFRQGRYKGWDCVCMGYWFSRATGSHCPKSEFGHERILAAPSPVLTPDAGREKIKNWYEQSVGRNVEGLLDNNYIDIIVKYLAEAERPVLPVLPITRADVYPWLNELIKRPGWNIGRFAQFCEGNFKTTDLADVIIAWQDARSSSPAVAPTGLIKNKTTPENKAFWNNVEKTAKEVDSWAAPAATPMKESRIYDIVERAFGEIPNDPPEAAVWAVKLALREAAPAVAERRQGDRETRGNRSKSGPGTMRDST